MNTIIIYHTKWGSSKQYAGWLAEEIGAEMIPANEFDGTKLHDLKNVCLFSRTYMGRIQIAGLLKKFWPQLKTKNVILVAVGQIPEEKSKESFELIPEEIRTNITNQIVPGNIDLKKLNFVEKKIVKMMRSKEPTEEIAMSREHLDRVKEYIKNIQ